CRTAQTELPAHQQQAVGQRIDHAVAVDVQRRAGQRGAVQLEDFVGVFVGPEHHSAAVWADGEGKANVTASHQRTGEFGDAAADERHAVKLDDSSGVLVGFEYHAAAVGADDVIDVNVTAARHRSTGEIGDAAADEQ